MKINMKISLQQFLPLSEAEMRVSFIQLMPILDIFLRGFSLSSCSQHSLKRPLAPKPHVSFKVCTQL
jgi:hypothetical protein